MQLKVHGPMVGLGVLYIFLGLWDGEAVSAYFFFPPSQADWWFSVFQTLKKGVFMSQENSWVFYSPSHWVIGGRCDGVQQRQNGSRQLGGDTQWVRAASCPDTWGREDRQGREEGQGCRWGQSSLPACPSRWTVFRTTDTAAGSVIP